MCLEGRRIPFDFQRTSLAGLALESATSSGLGRAPALQCRTPSRHHLELQDRRDYTPADRAARTCWKKFKFVTRKKIKLGQCSLSNVGLWSGREKKKREIGMARKRAENREGSLGFPGFVKPVFTKDSKPLGRRKRSLGHLGSVKLVLT
ncbi:hypothetical protein TNCV_2933631 [Trichonephila clavipes]|nr:hypothetical protein TNCV_2933631 [Trichonephila clavipes]